MTPQVSDVIPGSLEDTYKDIEVADRHHITVKQKGRVQIKRVMITEIFSSRRCTTYFWHHIYVVSYFHLLL